MFMRTGLDVEHHIEPERLELVSDYLTLRGGTGIPDWPIISDALHC